MFMRWSLTRRRSVQLRGEVQKLSDVKRELSGDVLILTRFGGSYEMSSNNVDGPYRGSYGGTDGLLAEERHIDILGHFLYTAKLVAKQEGLDDRFQNCQLVYHIHVHLIGGRQMNWPPG
ncbi:hypothetical protein Bca52824_016986 [Brassica carinata]|uniref:Uncharacterized protein n=1 Tax=Brassica carinata TaxID=52824 RepID=A0A8X7VMC0_BRACI|nr:hypothetical protein Bca52824_016986 [Brassica carinata]